MSVLEKLKTKGGIVLAIIIGISLVAFIMGDLLDPNRSLFTVRNTDVAKVKGNKISYTALNNKIQELNTLYKMQVGEQSFDETVQHGINTQAYNTLVNEIIMNDEYKALGMQVSSDELFDLVQGQSPHSIIRSMFTNQETGTFDRSSLLYFLKNKDNDATGQQQLYWSFVENEIYNEQMANKYINLVQRGLYIPSYVIDNDVQENGVLADIAYVMRPYSSMSDSLVRLSRAEGEAYYQQHINEFKQSEGRDIDYVLFEVKPSADDDAAALKWIETQQADFAATENPGQFVALNSDEKYDENNYRADQLIAPVDTLFTAELGAMVGPYKDGDTYKLSRLAEINMIPDSIRARHILIQPTEMTPDATAKAQHLADSLCELIRNGADFKALAVEYSVDKASAEDGGDLGWFVEATMVKDFTDAAFALAKGEVAVVQTNFGYHVLQVTDRGPAVRKVKIATLVRNIIPSSQTYQNVYAAASTFAGQNTTLSAFASAAAAQQLSIMSATGLASYDYKVADYSAREVVRWAYNAKVGDVSPCISLSDAYIVATLKDVREEGVMPFEQVMPVVNLMASREKKGKMIAAEMAEATAGATTLADAAAKLSLAVDTARNVGFSSYAVQTIGVEPRVAALATMLPEGTLSQPIVGSSGVYMIQPVAVQKDEYEDRNISETRLRRNMDSRADEDLLEALHALSGIKDLRAKFF
ncbi:MAG: peptidylprolyl isomerase [Bacteroidales bacterium]|nr:peptidylprolyl isomerase [Bacteroidales bacterium]